MLVIALTPGGLPAAGFWWDWLGGLGFCALAVIAYLGFDSDSPVSNQRLHRNLALVASILTAIHVLGYLLLDRLLIEYLKPTAPLYMLAGLLGVVGVVGATTSAFPTPRRRIFSRFSTFRIWHRWLVAVTVIGSLWHVLGTRFSIWGPLKVSLMVLLTLLLPGAAFVARRLNSKLMTSVGPDSNAKADREAWALSLLLILFATSFALIKVSG